MRLATLIVSICLALNGFSQWTLKGSVIDGTSADDLCGGSVAMSEDGNTIAFGGQNNGQTGSNAGHVRVFSWDGTAWQQMGSSIYGEAAGDNFGISCDLSSNGQIIVIGAYKNDGVGMDAGHTQVYEWDGSDWQQMGADIEGQVAGDHSGLSVRIDDTGTTIIIGDYYNDNTAFLAGSARVYNWNGSNWVMLGSAIDGDAFGDNFGFSTTINDNGDVVAIGAIGNDVNGGDAGQVKAFEWSGSAWIQKGTDFYGDLAGDNAGSALALSSDGNRLAIGYSTNDFIGSNAGMVRIFEWSGSNWIQLGTDLHGAAADEEFGHSLEFNEAGDHLVIGSIKSDVGATIDHGSVSVYAWDGSSWNSVGSPIFGEGQGDWFGKAVDISADGSTIVCGGVFNDNNGSNSGQMKAYYFCSSSLNTSVTMSGFDLTAASGYSYQWLDCDNAYAPISGATNQTYSASQNGNYAVVVSDGICSDTSSCYTIAGIGLEELDQLAFYPNPVVDDVFIPIQFNAQSYLILAMDGRVISDGIVENGEIDLRHLSSGTFVLQIKSQRTIFVKQ